MKYILGIIAALMLLGLAGIAGGILYYLTLPGPRY